MRSAYPEVMIGAFDGTRLEIDRLAGALEAMTESQRVDAVRALRKQDMVAIWAATAGRAVDATDFVDADAPLGSEVVHAGKNSLPIFNHFEKRFTPAEGRPGVLYGYNHNWFNWTTAGPGYFVAHHDPAQDEFGLDYYVVPPSGARLPDAWPDVVPNERGLQRLIYSKMVDYMRKVCEGVTIGRAWTKGKQTDNYFVLARTSH